MNRNERAKAAQETLNYFNQGLYNIGSKTISCASICNTEFISIDKLEAINMGEGNCTPKYEVVNESVIDTIFRLAPVGVLNFASAKNPGGGFLNGSLAQEEALAISSDLYNSQLQAQEFYDINRQCKTALYTHNMIYSKDVTFIRGADMNTVPEPVKANILTCPAVNAGAFYKNERGNAATVKRVMAERIRHILNVFAAKGDRKIILGAYGCGVFGNDPADVADIFCNLLKTKGVERYFDYISFAVYDRQGHHYETFKKRFATIIEG